MLFRSQPSRRSGASRRERGRSSERASWLTPDFGLTRLTEAANRGSRRMQRACHPDRRTAESFLQLFQLVMPSQPCGQIARVGRYCDHAIAPCGGLPHSVGGQLAGVANARRDYLLGAVRIAIFAAPARLATDMMSTAEPRRTFLSPRMSSVSEPASVSALRISASRFPASSLRDPR